MAFNDPVQLLPEPMEENSKNFMNIDTCDYFGDPKLFFNSESFEIFSSKDNMADIVSRCGIFPSRSQAKKNGWDIQIPEGFNCFVVGKKKFQIWILNCKKAENSA
jgi:hypothetical protein